VLELDGEGHMNPSCEKLSTVT